MNQYDLAVIGGGASGLAAAAAAASLGDSVIILEGSNAVGKKILVSGNGRCNLMNAGKPRYYGNALFAGQVLQYCGKNEQTVFWQDLGLLLSKEDSDGRIYPCTYQSASVLDALKTYLRIKHVHISLNSPVRECCKTADCRFCIRTNDQYITADRILVATGSPAGQKASSACDGYTVLEKFGHEIHPIRPALVPLYTDHKSISGLAGIRSRCFVALKDNDNNILHTERGEVLFTETGVSGICIMQCARFIRENIAIELDLVDRIFNNDSEFEEELIRRRKVFAELSPAEMLKGILPAKLSFAVVKQAGIPIKGNTLKDIGPVMLRTIIYTARHYRISVTGSRGIEDAQVCAGGADCSLFSSENMESKLEKGLYASGEVLDIDGDCGGFNLMFAFGSGILAGVNGRTSPYTTFRREKTI